jgi:hypothetical protein
MVSLGEWERAVAVAPGVNMTYWQELSSQYGRKLAGDLSEDCIPFFGAAGAAEEGVEFYAKRNQYGKNVVTSPPALPTNTAPFVPGTGRRSALRPRRTRARSGRPRSSAEWGRA